MESNQDVFISHSSADSKLAFAMCDYLEEKGIRCWIAPRNIPVGVKYGKSIIMGVKTCKIMVVLFNRNSNASEAVETEVERAFNYKTILIPFKLDETIPSESLEFSFGSFQWLNATKGKPEDHFDLLYQNCARALGKKESPIKEKPILPLTHEKKDSPIKEKSVHYQVEKNSLANKENESKKKKSIILIASLGAILLISIFFYMRKNLKVDEGEVTIGKQIWTTKNLDVETYCNGDAIPQVQDAAAWKNLKTGAWCYYENKTANGATYGKLYNWFAVNDPRGLAPKGFHIPTDAEWKILTDYLGGETIAGAKMKSSSGWEKNGNGTNTIGFAGLPGGLRGNDIDFLGIGASGFWWSSSEDNTSFADSAKVRHILIGLNDPENKPKRTKEEAKREADSLLVLIKSKKAIFDTLVKTISDDMGSKTNGGDYGWFDENKGFVTPFKNAGLEGSIGNISVVETEFGYHIIEVLNVSKTRHTNYNRAWSRALVSFNGSLIRSNGNKLYGASVRCLRD